MHTGQVAVDDVGSRYAFGWYDARLEGERVIQHGGALFTFNANLGMLATSDDALVVLAAHSSQLFDASAPFVGGMRVLAGASTPDIDRSYLFVEMAIVATAIAQLLLLTAGTVGLLRRLHRIRLDDRDWLRMVVLPALGYLTAAGAIAVLVLLAISPFHQKNIVLGLSVLSSVVPDLSIVVAVGVVWLVVAGIITLFVGFGRQTQAN